MPVTAVVGGQYGSEGKGKVAAYLSSRAAMAIRIGGPNAGHTHESQGALHMVRAIPSACSVPACRLAIPAGGIIDIDVLMTEVRRWQLGPDRLVIDPSAMIICAQDRVAEQEIVGRVRSTGSGTGSALARKVMRKGDVRRAGEAPELRGYIGDVAGEAYNVLSAGKRVILEGAQGTGLSLHHGSFPYVTGRDTTVGSMCGEAGVAPGWIDDIILVVRTFPIRVAGSSGPLARETAWEVVRDGAGYAEPLQEISSVTRKVRRVAEMDETLVQRAIMLNRPTQVALNFVDYWNASNRGASRWQDLCSRTRQRITSLEDLLGVRIGLIGTGPEAASVVVRS